MSNASETTKNWRKITKARMVAAMGGACVICGYSKCHGSLAFHHLDPSEKEFSFGNLRANPRAWMTVVTELRKCVMLCTNCHGEVHDGVATVPENATRFDEAWADPKTLKSLHTGCCPVCANPMRPGNQTCSLRCAGLKKNRVDWESYDLREIMKTMTYQQIADQIGISLSAVSKHIRTKL